jgi:hypothetical protein
MEKIMRYRKKYHRQYFIIVLLMMVFLLSACHTSPNGNNGWRYTINNVSTTLQHTCTRFYLGGQRLYRDDGLGTLQKNNQPSSFYDMHHTPFPDSTHLEWFSINRKQYYHLDLALPKEALLTTNRELTLIFTITPEDKVNAAVIHDQGLQPHIIASGLAQLIAIEKLPRPGERCQ